MRSFRLSLLTALSMLSITASAQVIPLPSYNMDVGQTSVSGLSAGGFMAVQFNVAFSSQLKGAGIMAGGPYYCAKGSLSTAQLQCMAGIPLPPVDELVRITRESANAGAIDAPSNLASHRIWLFSGTEDPTVKQPVMDQLEKYYRKFVGAGNLFYKKNLGAGHAVPTDAFGNACAATAEPYINNCAYDGAGELLKWIYGNLNLPNTEAPKGSFIEFDQSAFIANPNSHSMAETGWAYVPENCSRGDACRLHIVFHGCKQYPDYRYFSGSGMVRFSRTFVDNAGYNRWADTNNIVVLYPQTINGNGNPNGCWDWWGYDDPDYAKQSGRQMKAVKAMVDRIAVPALPAPQNVRVGDVTEDSVSTDWSAVDGASGYHVYRNRAKVTATPLTATAYTDAGLASGTPYEYQVRAIDSSGREGSPSAPVTAKTAGMAPAVPAPGALMTGKVTASSVQLSWGAALGVAGYNVFYRRDAAGSEYSRANSTLLSASSYTVAGLQAGTGYFFVVRSQNDAGALSDPSNEVGVVTPAAGACFTASNFDHVRAGRARASGIFVYAKGSNAQMGLNNIFFMTPLRQTGPDHYVIDPLTCP